MLTMLENKLDDTSKNNWRAESIMVFFLLQTAFIFFYGTFNSLKEHCPNFFSSAETETKKLLGWFCEIKPSRVSRKGAKDSHTPVTCYKSSLCEWCMIQRKKLWAVFFVWTEGPMQKLKQFGEKKLNSLKCDIRRLCSQSFQLKLLQSKIKRQCCTKPQTEPLLQSTPFPFHSNFSH